MQASRPLVILKTGDTEIGTVTVQTTFELVRDAHNGSVLIEDVRATPEATCC